VPRNRLIAMGVAGAGAAAALLALFPGLVAGPLADTDPRLALLWHARVAENHPLAPVTLNRTGQFLFFIGAAAIAIPYAAFMGWRDRTSLRSMPWFFLAAACALYFTLALLRFRLAPFAEIVSAPLIADMIARLIDWSERHLGTLRRMLVNCAASFVLMFGTMLAGAYLLTLTAEASDGKTEPACEISEIAPVLNDPNGLGARPLIISGLLDHGPEILYRTPHSVVSTPYHRNGAGIWDSYRILAATEEAESRAIVARRGIDLLLLCPSGAERRFFDNEETRTNLYNRLLNGDTPGWLAPVAADPAKTGDFRLFRVLR
jgi:hypothetical protein